MMKVLHLNNLSCWWQICNKIFFFAVCSQGIIFLRCFVNLIRLMCWFASGPKLYVCKMCWFSGKNEIIFHDWLHFFARVLTWKMGSKHLWICNRIFLTHCFLTSQGLKVYKLHTREIVQDIKIQNTTSNCLWLYCVITRTIIFFVPSINH